MLGAQRDADRVELEEKAVLKEKISLETKIREMEEAKRKEEENVTEITDAGMTKEDLSREV